MHEDYPRTLSEFEARFATERACRAFLAQLRWPDGFVCPRCQAGPGRPATRQRLICGACRYQASVTAGTIFHGSRQPLTLWLRAIWRVTAQKNGAGALGPQRILGLGQYRTAWIWLHKLRRAMVRAQRDRLSGCVEVDEIYVGGPEKGAPGRSRGRKSLVAVAAEEDGDGIGRIRLRRAPDASASSLQAFILDAVELGSLVRTDGWRSYSQLHALGYRHRRAATGGDPERIEEHFPRVHRVAALLKRWLLGTHQGAVRKRHLDYYLDEFTFRFNRRTSRSRGLLFYRLLQQAVITHPAPESALVAPSRARSAARSRPGAKP